MKEFNPSDLCKYGGNMIPLYVMDRLIKWHFNPLMEINKSVPIHHINSFRTRDHERENGRDPNDLSNNRKHWSVHTFAVNERDPLGKGGSDVSSKYMFSLVELIEKHMKVSRIAVYSWGVHVDYAWGYDEVKLYDSNWSAIGRDAFNDKLKQIDINEE